MADDYTNTAEHYLPVPAIADKYDWSRDIEALRIRIDKGLAGLAAYHASGTNYVLAAANAGAILSSVGAAPRGRVIGAASGQDPQLSFQLNTGAALATAWTLGVDDNDSDKFKIESDATLGAATPAVAITSAGWVGWGTATPPAPFVISNATAAWGQLQVHDPGTTEAGIGFNAKTPGSIGVDGMWVVGAGTGSIGVQNLGFGVHYLGGYAQRLILTQTGAVLMNGAVVPTANADGTLIFADKAEPTLAANTAGLYADDVLGTVEMFAVGEDQTQTQISPHDPETGEFYHRSSNAYTGRQLVIWMERAFRALEKLTGEKFIEETWRPIEDRLDWDAIQAEQIARREQEIAAWDDSNALNIPCPEPYVAKAPPTYIAAAIAARGALPEGENP